MISIEMGYDVKQQFSDQTIVKWTEALILCCMQMDFIFEELVDLHASGRRFSKSTLRTFKSMTGPSDTVQTFVVPVYLMTGMVFGDICTMTGEVLNTRIQFDTGVQVRAFGPERYVQLSPCVQSTTTTTK